MYFLAVPLVAGAAEPVAPSAESAAGVDRVEEVRLSPDGRSLVYALLSRERLEGEDRSGTPRWKVQTQLWAVRDLGPTQTPPRRLTTAQADAEAPAWASDGSAIAFLRDGAEERAAIHVLPIDGGEAEVVDTGELEPSAFAWSPDGRSFAFAAEVPETEEEERARAATGGVKRFGHEFRPSVLWTVSREGGEPVRVGDSALHVVELHWSPDGERLAVIAADTADPYDEMLSARPFVVTRDGSWRVLDEERGAIECLRWAPDGRHLAWLKAGDTLTLLDVLRVSDPNGSSPIDAGRTLDATFTDVGWAGPDTLIALTTEKTRTQILRIAADGSKVERLAGLGDRPVLAKLDVARSADRLAVLASSPSVPPEPAWLDLASGGPPDTVAAFGTVPTGAEVAGWIKAKVEVVQWKGPGGATLEGVLSTPANPLPGRLPLLVFPHGGPDSVTLESFSPWVQHFTGRGYAVLQPNYRGGVGYGRAFYAANRGKLGAIEFADIEAGVDSLIRAGRVDPNRMVYGGWSWGGYLTAWTIGHTDRYRAAIAGAAVVDVVNQYALSDVNHGAAAEWEYLGNPWEVPAKFAKSNPLASLHRARTPTLILHGESDVRVHPTSSILLWRALTDLDVETELLLFPGEPHGIKAPVHVTHLLERWTAWMDGHLANPVAAGP